MSKSKLAGKVQTVLGLVEPEDLGITLPHEHCLLNMDFLYEEPTKNSEVFLAHQPVSFENLWWVRYHPTNNRDNVGFLDEEMAISELLRFKNAGGSTIVDMSIVEYGRDPLAIARISRATGLNIIMGCGHYPPALPAEWNPTEEMLTEEMMRDITVGVGDTGIRAGMLGQLGITWPMRNSEKALLRAAARVQKETGAPIAVSVDRSPDSPFEAIEVLNSVGADLSRVQICHIDRTVRLHDTRVKLAKTGCYLEYGLFGWEGWYPLRIVLSEDSPKKGHLPNDADRVDEIMALIDEGFLNQILLSYDYSYKIRFCRYGGPGYAHILCNVVPVMREKGMPEEHIHTLLVENPKRLLRCS